MIVSSGHIRRWRERLLNDYSDVFSPKQVEMYLRAVAFQGYGIVWLILSFIAMIIATLERALPESLISIFWYVAVGVCALLELIGQIYSSKFSKSIGKSLGLKGTPLYSAMVYGGRKRFDQRLAFMRSRQELRAAEAADAKRRGLGKRRDG